MIFLSYSRKDTRIVRQMEGIIRALGLIPWRDENSIKPGAIWDVEIAKNINSCERMLVFWCRHSEASAEVENEYSQAIEKRKPVVPILMDKKQLCPKLQPYQAIDLRKLMWWSHEIARVGRISWLIGALLMIIGGIYAALF